MRRTLARLARVVVTSLACLAATAAAQTDPGGAAPAAPSPQSPAKTEPAANSPATNLPATKPANAKGGKAPVSLNERFRKLALAQGPINAAAWPLPPASGTTGGDPAYGWSHAHLLSAGWARAVIQCYAARPAYYTGAPMRSAGYLVGCRPLGWKPEGKGDLPTGEWLAPGGVKVSGPDFEHFPLNPLFELADSTGLTVPTPTGPQPAETVARELLRHLLAAHAGMLRTPKGLTTYVGSARALHWILRNLVDGGTRGLLAPADLATLNDYVMQVMLPALEQTPETRVYNGLAWELPALWDLWKLSPEGELKTRLRAVIDAQAALAARLCKLVPGKALQVDHVKTWGPELAAAGVVITDYYEPWEIRSMLCAAAALGDAPEAKLCAKEAAQAIARWKGRPEGPDRVAWKPWFVAADGSVIPWK